MFRTVPSSRFCMSLALQDLNSLFDSAVDQKAKFKFELWKQMWCLLPLYHTQKQLKVLPQSKGAQLI